MTILLTNTGGRCQVFVLAHESYCAALGACACQVEPGRPARRVPRSLTLASGVTSPELSDAVLTIPEVARAARRGDLSVKQQPATATTPASLPPVFEPKNKKKRGLR